VKTITAFVAKSFHADDQPKTEQIEQFLSRFKRLGFAWQTAEPAEVESVSVKVRRLIDASDVFVGILTRRSPLCRPEHRIKDAANLLLGRTRKMLWSPPPWVLQESGYALKADKPVVLFREVGVDIGALQGDLEYITRLTLPIPTPHSLRHTRWYRTL
jgi:hypothetical protein